MRMNEYNEISIPFNKNNYDTICNKIYMAGNDLTIEEDIGCLKLYAEDNGMEVIKQILTELENEYIIDIKDVTIKKYESKNWNAEWERSIEPVLISDRMIVFPSWKKDELVDREGKILITIDPKMSFGTGHNETTQLMLEMFCDHLDDKDHTMLDVGTGTGILSIAGIKLGLTGAVAFDIDKDSIENAEEYAKINKVEEKIVFLCTSIKNIEEKKFDVVAANIIRSVIVDNLSEILLRLKEGGKLFISGVLQEEEELIRKTLNENGIDVIEVRNKAEWLGIYALKTA
ncbi:50S ribosomal protein L11 methyltransferase [soil metagenome]